MSNDTRSTREMIMNIEYRLQAIEESLRPIVELVEKFAPKLEKFRKFL